MGRTKGSVNKPKQPEHLVLDGEEKLSVLADLLLDLVVDELSTLSESGPCKTS